MIDPWPNHVEAIRDGGLRLLGPGSAEPRVARIPAFHIGEWWRIPTIDVLVIAAKSFDNRWLAPLLAPRLSDDATVVSAQNGVNEPELSELLGAERMVGAVVLFPAEVVEPGRVRMDGEPTLLLGELHGTRTERAERVRSALGSGVSTPVSGNIWGAIWSKLVMNCMSNPVNAVLGGRARDCREQPGPRRISLACGSEAVAVGRTLGHDVEPVSSIAAEQILIAGGGGPGFEKLAAAWEATAAELGEVKGSMPTDIERGHKTEIDSFSGYVASQGRLLGIPTPVNDAVYELVVEIESGARTPGPHNLEDLLGTLS